MSDLKKSRAWATIIYPQDSGVDWRKILPDLKVSCAVSPCHNLDLKDDMSIKKAHYHVLWYFDGPVTSEQAQQLVNAVSGVGLERVRSVKRYARYLCHLDEKSPLKPKYSIDDVSIFSGFDYQKYISLPDDDLLVIGEIMSFVNHYKCFSFSQLCNFARDNNLSWFRVLVRKSTIYISQYLKSAYYSELKIDKHCPLSSIAVVNGKYLSSDGEILGVCDMN